jgi:cGMP-dependent protein kinase
MLLAYIFKVAKEPNTVFALKCLPKATILATQQKEHVYAEKNIMLSCNSPFIARYLMHIFAMLLQ